MAVEPAVHVASSDVRTRLADLGLNEGPLLHAARRWHLAWSSFTSNHPPAGIGIASWTEGFGALREQLVSLGWERSDKCSYSLVVSPNGSIAINLAAGDAGTGRPECTPSNKARRGASTAEAISVNQQQLEFDLPVPDVPHVRGEEGPMTWFLLLFRSETDVRGELSLPADISDGRVTRWQERIILPSIPLDEKPFELVAPQGPDLVIDIKRRK